MRQHVSTRRLRDWRGRIRPAHANVLNARAESALVLWARRVQRCVRMSPQAKWSRAMMAKQRCLRLPGWNRKQRHLLLLLRQRRLQRQLRSRSPRCLVASTPSAQGAINLLTPHASAPTRSQEISSERRRLPRAWTRSRPCKATHSLPSGSDRGERGLMQSGS